MAETNEDGESAAAMAESDFTTILGAQRTRVSMIETPTIESKTLAEIFAALSIIRDRQDAIGRRGDQIFEQVVVSEINQELRSIRTKSTSFPGYAGLPMYTAAVNFSRMITDSASPFPLGISHAEPNDRRSERFVSVDALARSGGAICFAISIFSLVLWNLYGFTLINPAVSVIFGVASACTFVMTLLPETKSSATSVYRVR